MLFSNNDVDMTKLSLVGIGTELPDVPSRSTSLHQSLNRC